MLINGWIALAIVMYCGVIGIALSFALRSTHTAEIYVLGRYRNKKFPRSPKRRIITSIIALVVGVAIINGFSWVTTLVTNPGGTDSKTLATSKAVTTAFGLTPKQSYPLVLGSRVGSSENNLNVESGLFFTYVSLHTMSGSAVTVSFTHQSDTYMLEIPTVKTVFVQSTTATPSVTFYFQKSSYDKYEDYYYGTPLLKQTVTKDYTSCSPQVANLTIICGNVKLVSKDIKAVPLSATAMRHGLAPIVTKYIDSATITLTPQMYDQLSGRID